MRLGPQDQDGLPSDAVELSYDEIEDSAENDLAGLFDRFSAEELAMPPGDPAEHVRLALIYHGASPVLVERILAEEEHLVDAAKLLSKALGRVLRFSSLSYTNTQRIMLVGAPGVGKSSLIAKIAAGVYSQTPTVFTTDTVRPGGSSRLAEYLATIEIEPKLIEPLQSGFVLPTEIPGQVLIDTAGIDIADADALSRLTDLATAMSAEIVLVISALCDPAEAEDLAKCFHLLGSTKLLVTRLDMARRLGALLAAAEAGLAICGGSITANFAYGLTPLSPVLLTDRLLKTANL